MIAKINLNKNFIVYGLGISGVSVAQKLFDYGFEVIATDDNPQSISKFSEKFPKIPTKQSSEIVLNSDSVVVFAPGIPLYFPKRHRILEAVEKAKADLVCDIELFFRFYSEPVQNLYLQRPSEQNSQTSDARCMPLYQSSFCALGFENAAHLTRRSEILKGFSENQNHFSAITGTNGKSTTTALSGFIFQELKLESAIGGNIGRAAFELPQNQQNFSYIFETSSFQLDLISSARFNIAALLNITKDHIDRHGNMENYISAKKRIFCNQKSGDFALINIDCPNSNQVFLELKSDRNFAAELLPISNKQVLDQGISLIGNCLSVKLWGLEAEFKLESDFLLGSHNWQNMAFAFAIALCRFKQKFYETPNNSEAAISEAGKIIQAIKKFKGLQHRMQILGKINGLNFVNDSKATNAESSANALLAFDKIFWILGGRPKEGGIELLLPLLNRIHKAYLIGEASEQFAEFLKKNSVPFALCGDLRNAFEMAANEGRQAISSGNLSEATILLSPACASFDQWKNFEERGNAFCLMFKALNASK